MILCLLMRNDGVFCNSRDFKLQPVGELAWIRRYLSFDAIDELVLLNIDRKPKSMSAFAGQLRQLGRLCFVPIAAGGGVSTLEHFEELLRSGADKVVINSQAVRDPGFITEAARRFGSQCVVVSIDYRGGLTGSTVIDNGQKCTGRTPLEWAREIESRGAGEIFLTSVDCDGTGTGYDLATIRAVSEGVNIPVIASGGVGEFSHLVDGIVEGKASAVSAANIFHYIGNGLEKAKQYLASQGADFPMWNFM